MHTEPTALTKLTSLVPDFPDTVLVLGSGWNTLVKVLDVETTISYEDLFGVTATVPGHTGTLVIARYQAKRVAIMSGRLHMYEGFTARESTLPIRVMAQAGARRIILTSAVGALNETYQVGDFVVLSDLITVLMSLDNPLVGPQFVDMSAALSSSWRQQALAVARDLQLSVHEGVYAYYHGPNYETPADKRAIRILGADVVGMSTVPETIMARALNMEVLGLSFVTNLAFVKHDHTQVVAEAEKAQHHMHELLVRCF